MYVRMAAIQVGVCCIVLTAFLASAQAEDAVEIPDNTVELFLDNYLIADMTGLTRQLKEPERHSANPLITQTLPWEQRCIEMYGTVVYDEDAGKYRGWYLASGSDAGIPDTPEHPGTAEYPVCYAESDDGVNWTKPMVGGAYGEYEQTNIVIADGINDNSVPHGWCLLDEPNDPDPQRRYKGAGGSVFGTSPDGIQWTLNDWSSAVGKNDTGTSVVKWKGQYLAYVRNQGSWENGVLREVGVSVSDNFVDWSWKQTVLTTNAEDGSPWTQPYSLSVTAYGDQLIGVLSVLHLDEVEGNNAMGYRDMQLVVSRDGVHWDRVADRAVFMSPEEGQWDSGQVWPSTTLVVKDGVVQLYYSGTNERHGEGWGDPAIGLATLPEDRFVAIGSEDGDAASLQTRLLRLTGNDLVINAELLGGNIQVELLDEEGELVEGCDAAGSQLVFLDDLHYRVVWNSAEGDIHLYDALAENPELILRFVLSGDSELYSFRTLPEPTAAVLLISGGLAMLKRKRGQC